MSVPLQNFFSDFQQTDMLAGSCSSKYVSEKYDFKLYSDFSKFEKDMYAKENEVGLSRMLAGYAWPWISKNDQALKDIEIQDVKRMWNHCTEGPAGGCHCTDVDRFPSILLDEDPARFQDLLLGRCHRIRVTTSST